MKITRSIVIYCLLSNFFVPLTTFAKIVKFPIQELFNVQPSEFANTVLFDLGIIYPNGCYKPEAVFHFSDFESRKIFLFHTAKKKDGLCTMALVKIALSLELPIPGNGTYSVIDFVTDQTLGKIVVTNERTAYVFKCLAFCN